MSTSVQLPIPVVSFRHLETPFQKQGYRDYFAVVKASDLPDLTNWRNTNVRDPKSKGKIPNAIRESFRANPEKFLYMNRGITISVEKIEFDNQTSTVKITLADPNIHGLLDGGHTYSIVREESNNRKELDQNGSTHDPYVRVEFLEGFDREDIVDVVDARNTSNQVKDESLMNLEGKFEDLKKALGKSSFFEQIAFNEHTTDSEGFSKPIDIREIVAILTLFDKENYSEQKHPVQAYSAKREVLDKFGKRLPSFKKLYPIAEQLLLLYDHVRNQLPDLYNEARPLAGDVTGGKFGKLTGVTYFGKKTTPLYYLGTKSEYGVPDGFTYPMLAAFRAFLVEENGQYTWAGGVDPIYLLNNGLGLKLASKIGEFAREHKNPNKVGKSASHWMSCYETAENMLLKSIIQEKSQLQ